MNSRSSVRFFLSFAALVVVIGTGLAVQRRQSKLLRAEQGRAKNGADELRQLQTENQRLRDKQIPAAELERLRADHAALPRLRAELDALTRQVTPSSGK